MIDGLRVDVPGAKLREHCAARGKFYAERAAKREQHAEQMAEWNKQGEGADDPDVLNSVYDSQVSNSKRGLLSLAVGDRTQAAWFNFLAETLSADEVYRLTQHELVGLEFAKP